MGRVLSFSASFADTSFLLCPSPSIVQLMGAILLTNRSREAPGIRGDGYDPAATLGDATHRPFAGLEALLNKKD